MSVIRLIFLVLVLVVSIPVNSLAQSYTSIGLRSDIVSSYSQEWDTDSSPEKYNERGSQPSIAEIYGIYKNDSILSKLNYMQSFRPVSDKGSAEYEFKEGGLLIATKPYFDFIRYGVTLKYRTIQEAIADGTSFDEEMYGLNLGLIFESKFFHDHLEAYCQLMPYIGWREDERLDIEGFEAGWNVEGGLKYWFLDYLALSSAITYDKYSFDAQRTAIFKYQKYYDQDYTLKKFMAGIEYKF